MIKILNKSLKIPIAIEKYQWNFIKDLQKS